MKRIFLFIATNILIVATISIVLSVFGVGNYMTANGLNYGSLLAYSLVVGFTGAFISLLISRPVAKFSMGVKTITPDDINPKNRMIYESVQEYAQRLGIKMPEVGFYESDDMNAFATGRSKNASLVAVTTGLRDTMTREQVKAVLAHEMAHINNGDMVTMTLLQGVINTFVVFISRCLASIINGFLKERNIDAYYIIAFILDLLLGFLGMILVAAYSRRREFYADEGGAFLAGKQNMIAALETLGRVNETRESNLKPQLKAFGISGSKMFRLFASHPPIEDRINALKQNSSPKI